jgi:hypothetical protein
MEPESYEPLTMFELCECVRLSFVMLRRPRRLSKLPEFDHLVFGR